MKRLTPGQIAESFNSIAESEDYLRDLRCISLALGDLRDAGMNVSLELLNANVEEAFKMKPANVHSIWLKESGILHIGNSQRLLAYVSSIRKTGESPQESSQLLLISQLDIRYQGDRKQFRHLCFDLRDDPDALVKLQSFIIQIAAHHAANRTADAAGVFTDMTAAQAKARVMSLSSPGGPLKKGRK